MVKIAEDLTREKNNVEIGRVEIPVGYKLTELGLIPEDWNPIKLGDKAIKIGSGITPTGGEKIYQQSGRPFVRSQNIGDGHLLIQNIAFIDDETHESFKSTELITGDVLLNITGASIGRCATATHHVQGGNVNQHVCIIRPNKKELDSEFLKYSLLSSIGQRQIDSFQAGGNREGLNFGQIRSFTLLCPSLKEQQAVVAALNDIDSLITNLDELVAKKRDIKQAAMQQLLTGKQRLPGFRDEWKHTKLKNIGKFSKGKGIKKEDVFQDGVPCIRYGEIYTHHNDVIKQFYSFIPEVVVKESQILKFGDLLFTLSGETANEIGKCVAFVSNVEAYAGGDIAIFSPIGQDSIFLGYLMNHSSITNQKVKKAQGDVVVHISARNLATIELNLPTLNEQIAISNIFCDMDSGIAALEQQREKSKTLKQGMMQELLTGRVRLI